jgi:hypothetical protein
MKANRLVLTVLFLATAAVFQLLAQQNEADRKVLGEIRAGADKAMPRPSMNWVAHSFPAPLAWQRMRRKQ